MNIFMKKWFILISAILGIFLFASTARHVAVAPTVSTYQINNGVAETTDRRVKLNNMVTGNKPTQFTAGTVLGGAGRCEGVGNGAVVVNALYGSSRGVR